MIRALLLGLAVALAGALWVRLAPTDPARWHTDPALGAVGPNSHVTKANFAGSPADALAALDAVAMASPRTQRIAGNPEAGRITWITRSALWGFPDFTTAAAVPDGPSTTLLIHARSRFGISDLGVNAARVKDWLARLRS